MSFASVDLAKAGTQNKIVHVLQHEYRKTRGKTTAPHTLKNVLHLQSTRVLAHEVTIDMDDEIGTGTYIGVFDKSPDTSCSYRGNRFVGFTATAAQTGRRNVAIMEPVGWTANWECRMRTRRRDRPIDVKRLVRARTKDTQVRWQITRALP